MRFVGLQMGGRLSLAFAFVIVLFDFIFFEFAAANVVVIGKNVTLSFDDVEANFGEFFSFSFCVLCFGL